jgi:hypothetical protein
MSFRRLQLSLGIMPETSSEKKNTGYTYWKREIPDSHILPSSAPRRIEHSSSEESLDAANRTSSGGLVSAWNAGTTYEEKNITDRAQKTLNQVLGQRMISGLSFRIKEMKGEVHAHCVRGKVKIGYEIQSLALISEDEKIVEVDDLDSTDPEGFSLPQTGGIPKPQLKEFVVELMNDVCNKLLTE